MAFRFIHTGDIHLDSPLRGLAGQDGAAASRIRTATRAAFANLIDYAIGEEVSFFIIAGDLYETETGATITLDCFLSDKWAVWQKREFQSFSCTAIMTQELRNHETPDVPNNVHVLAQDDPKRLNFQSDGWCYTVRVSGSATSMRTLSPAIQPTVEGSFNIGVLHTGLGGMGGHVNYAPCSLR